MLPKNYYKTVDQNGSTTSLLYQTETSCFVFQPVAAPAGGYEVNMAQVFNAPDLQAMIGGTPMPISPEEYNDTLFLTWGFSGSNIYKAGGKDEQQDERSANDSTGSAEENGSVAQGNDDADTGSESSADSAGNDAADAAPNALAGPADIEECQRNPLSEATGTIGGSAEAA